MNETKNIIEIQNVSKKFGSVAAVDGISFDIAQGEFFSLLGASGCGKTTLLRMLAGFEQPTDGNIQIDGQSMVGVPSNHRPTNMVFQSYAIFPHLNVEENVGYGLRNQKLGNVEAHKRTAAALDLVKLGGYGQRGAHQLSGGQRQRVALARALVCRPKVLLLDEPLGALDKKLREEMQIELRALQRSVGITFVFVTHDQEEALTLSDRIAVMSSGKVLQLASPEELYERPNCREVAGFIGNMNLIAGRIHLIAKGMAEIDAGEAGILRVPSAKLIGAKGSIVHLAVRPERLVLTPKKPLTKGNNVQGEIASETYLGDRRRYLVKARGVENPVAISQQNADAGTFSRLAIGTPVWISWRPEAGHLLVS